MRRGLYYISPLDSSGSAVVDDPWVLANELVSPSYIGGWTAAQHWELTEQLFRVAIDRRARRTQCERRD